MSGARSGAKAVVQKAAPKVMYHHCAAHRLNLSNVSSYKISMIQNAESFLGEIARFFSFSPKRQRMLDKAIEASDTTPKAKKLKYACRTRWVERIDSYAVFLMLLPAIHLCLDAMVHPHMHRQLGTEWNWDGETITKANGFLFQLHSSSFLVAFQTLLQVLHVLRELTMKLQMRAIDVVYAYKQVEKVISTLRSLRSDSVTEFRKQFSEALRIGRQLHGDISQLTSPRFAKQQQHRSYPSVLQNHIVQRVFVTHSIRVRGKISEQPITWCCCGPSPSPSKCVH